jgi:hypothetical protein
MRTQTLTVAVLLTGTPVLAGVRLQSETRENASGTVTRQEMLVDNTRLRTNITGKQNMSVLFLTEGGNRLVMIDHARNEYREMDQASIDQMAGQMQGMMAAMEEKLNSLPPEQRAMMEKMMKGKRGGANAPARKTVYTARGSATKNGFRCTQYEGTRGAEKVAELCAATPSVLSMMQSDYQVFSKMREFLSGFAKMTANSPFAPRGMDTLADTSIDGIPVHHVSFADGQPQSTTDLKSVQKATFTDADFSTGNAKRVDLPAMGGGRRKR